MIGICQEYFKVGKWTIWTICVFYKKLIIFLWSNIWAKPYCPWMKFIKYILKKTKKKQNSFCKKAIENPWKDNWFKLYFTHLIWIYLKFCQNRMYKWKHMYFYKNWSFFSKWTIWVKPYCPWLNVFSDFARYFGKCKTVWTRCAFDKIGQIFVKG